MANVIKITLFILMINIFVFIGINYSMVEEGVDSGIHVSGDLFDVLLENDNNEIQVAIQQERAGKNFTPAINLDPTLTSTPNQDTGEQIGDEGGISILDALKIFWAIIPTLINIIAVPIRLMTIGHIPMMLRLLIGVPLALMESLAIFLLIRGIG